ncbi:hypothetical protein UXF57_21335 [Escherichia coli]|nr:hypothetical protein [Escherichia coli]
MRKFIILLLFLSANAYSESDAYCALIWGVTKFRAESFKRVSEKTYDLTILTDPTMTLVSRVSRNVTEWYSPPLEGVHTYWGLFNSERVPIKGGNSFRIISIDGRNKPNFESSLAFGNHTWYNGCTVLSPGQTLNWGETSRIVLRVEFEKVLSAGYYNFSGMSIPVRIFYEENKGLYEGNRALVAQFAQKFRYISVDNWNLQIKAPTCKSSEVSIDFGKVTFSQVKSGINKTKNLSIYCENEPVSVKIYFDDTKKTVTERKCGNTSGEMNCKISVGNSDNAQKYVEFNSDYFQPSGMGTINIPIKATLKSAKPTPGAFKDSVILKIDIN